MQCQRSNTLRCVGIFLVAHAIFSCEHASQQTIQNSTSHDASVDTSADDAASSDTHGTLPDSSSDHADDESFDDSSATNDLSGETSADPKEILIVSAGSYQEEVQAMFVLRGEVSVQHSDAHPTLQWQQTRGPPARFIDPQSIATPRVEVPGPGRYRFRLVASTESSTAFADTLHHFGEVKQSEVRYVIHVSVDGLRADALASYLNQSGDGFARLLRESSYTLSARPDAEESHTLPNHASQLTGRPVFGKDGHLWSRNSVGPTDTMQTQGRPLESTFSAVYSADRVACATVGKSKFSLYRNSWGMEPQGSISRYEYATNVSENLQLLQATLLAAPCDYHFVHLAEPDQAGHSAGWDVTSGSSYVESVAKVDRYLAQLLQNIDAYPWLAGHTAIVLTADHGGIAYGHDNHHQREVYEIPLIVWHPQAAAGNTLGPLNRPQRLEPLRYWVASDYEPQPIRNADAANLSLEILGLGPVKGSVYGNPTPLRFRNISQ